MGKIIKLGIVIFMLLVLASFASAAISDSIKYYWTFNETSGNAVDSVVSANLVQTGTVGTFIGVINNSRGLFETGGTSNDVPTGYFGNKTILHEGIPSSVGYSISFWVKINRTNGDQQQNIFSKTNPGGNEYFECFGEQSIANISCFISTNGANNKLSTPYTLGQWHHFVITGNSSGKYMYKDGTLVSSNSDTDNIYTNLTANINFTVGMRGAIFNYGGLQGYVDELGIWNRSINNTEVTSLYNGGVGLAYPFSTDLLAPNTSATGIQQNGSAYTFGTSSYSSYINVSLSCTDNGGGSCSETKYCVDDSNTCTPNIVGNFTQINRLANESLTKHIRFFSNDTNNNIEPIQSKMINFTTNVTTTATAVEANGSNYMFGTTSNHSRVDITLNYSGNFNVSQTKYCVDTTNICAPNLLYNYTVNSYCYQESANVSNQTGIDGDCGLNYTGKYADYKIGTSTASLYINYTKPENATSAYWNIRAGIPATYSYEIPSSCINSNVQLLVNFTNVSTNATIKFYCYTGSTWLQSGNNLSSRDLSGIYNAYQNISATYDGNYSTGIFVSGLSPTFQYGKCNSGNCYNYTFYEEGINWIILEKQKISINKTTPSSLTQYIRYASNDTANTIESTKSSQILFRPTNISINITSPINDSHINTDQEINFTIVTDGNTSLNCNWTRDGGTTNTSVTCSNGTVTQIVGQTWSEGLNTIQIFVTDAQGFSSNSSVSFVKDTNSPTLIIQSPITTGKYFNITTTRFNITANDTNLYGFNVTCINNNVSEYSFQLINIPTSSFNFTEDIQLNKSGVTVCQVEVADSHTANNFDAKIEKKNGLFSDDELVINNEVTVKMNGGSDLKANIEYIKTKDRVSPILELEPQSISWLDELMGEELQDEYDVQWKVQFQGKADRIYSEYPGHVVILPDGDLSNGYWVDAVTNVGGPDETIITENEIIYKKKILRSKLEEVNYKIVTKSIGGLNVVTQNVSINITGGKWLEINSTNRVNGSDADINISLNYGYNITTYNSSGHIIVASDCNQTIVNLSSQLFMNSHLISLPETCGNTSIAAEFWQAELTANIKNILSNGLISNSNGTMNGSGDYNNESIFTTGTNKYYLNEGNFSFTAEATNFSTQNFNQSIALGDNTTRDYNLTPIYNITFRRELTGEPLNFYENMGTYQCSLGDINQTTFEAQDIVDSPTCIGNFTTDHPCTNAYDGYTNTYAAPVGSQTAQIVYQYPKPANVTNESYLLLQRDYITEVNMSIPQACFNENNIKLNYTFFNASYINVSCYNSTGYQFMNQYVNGALLFEDIMYWARIGETTNTSTCTNQTSINVRFEVQCENEVLVSNLNATDQTISNIDCAYDAWYILAEYNTESYFRSLIPDPNTFNFPVFLLDLNQDQAVEIIVQVKDLAANYLDGKLVVHKFINGSDEIVIEQFLDFEQKAILWLQKNQMYTICVEDDAGNIQCFKPIVADAAGTKILTLPQLDAILKGNEGLRTLNHDGTNQSAGIAVLNYYDKSSAGTKSLTWKITDEEGNVAYSTTNTNIHNLSLIASGLNRTSTYYSILTINVTNTPEGQLVNTRPLWMKEFSVFDGFGEGDGSGFRDVILLIIGILVPIFILMIGNERNGELMLAIALAIMFIFNLAHFYELMAKTPGQQIALGGILALFGLFAGLMWIRKARRAE